MAPTTAAPDSSVTSPVMVALDVACDQAGSALRLNRIARHRPNPKKNREPPKRLSSWLMFTPLESYVGRAKTQRPRTPGPRHSREKDLRDCNAEERLMSSRT